MKNEALYHKTVDILVQAYFNDTLERGNCAACAVGNIVAARMGYSFTEKHGGLNWKEVDAYDSYQNALNWYLPIISKEAPNKRQKEEIESTGYSFDNLIEIEAAFESSKFGNDGDERMFNGLMAVIDCLDEIHEVNSPEVSKTSKLKFQKINK